MRAAIMGGMGVVVAQVGRRQYGLNSLAFVAMLIELADSHVLREIGGYRTTGCWLVDVSAQSKVRLSTIIS